MVLVGSLLICISSCVFPFLVIRKAGYILKPGADLVAEHSPFTYLCSLAFIRNSEDAILDEARVGSFIGSFVIRLSTRGILFSDAEGRIRTEARIGFCRIYHLRIFAR